MKRLALALVAASTAAHADPAKEVSQRLVELASKSAHATSNVPRFAFTYNIALSPPGSFAEATMGLPEFAVVDASKTIVVSPDADTAVISTNLAEYSDCPPAGCPKGKEDTWLRATAVFERANGTWQPLAWSITPSIPGTSQLDAMEEGIVPEKLARDAGGADEVLKLFESTVGDPKAFTGTFSDRKDVLLLGSELPERYVGPKAKATFLQWSFAFGIRDGVRAGMSKSGNLAWVAANVDGKSTKHPKNNPVPYRMFVVYEKTAGGWKVAQIQFSTSV